MMATSCRRLIARHPAGDLDEEEVRRRNLAAGGEDDKRAQPCPTTPKELGWALRIDLSLTSIWTSSFGPLGGCLLALPSKGIPLPLKRSFGGCKLGRSFTSHDSLRHAVPEVSFCAGNDETLLS